MRDGNATCYPSGTQVFLLLLESSTAHITIEIVWQLGKNKKGFVSFCRSLFWTSQSSTYLALIQIKRRKTSQLLGNWVYFLPISRDTFPSILFPSFGPWTLKHKECVVSSWGTSNLTYVKFWMKFWFNSNVFWNIRPISQSSMKYGLQCEITEMKCIVIDATESTRN